jgi:tripartite-type tricarboxylate transporter receptor subunit TctC
MDNWYGFMAPLGTPTEAIKKLDAEVRKIMANPVVIQRLALVGIEPKAGNAEQLMMMLKSDLAQFKSVVDYARITVE